MLKNARLSRVSRDYPVASPSRRRGKSRSLFVATPSGLLTLSRAWQKVAPYSSRRPPARSPSRGRGKKSLLIRRDATHLS
jgi:hypothetical protein